MSFANGDHYKEIIAGLVFATAKKLDKRFIKGTLLSGLVGSLSDVSTHQLLTGSI